MKEITNVLNGATAPATDRLKARKDFLKKRTELWERIRDGRFPAVYLSSDGRKFVGAPRKTAIRCDFLLASKMVLGSKFTKDKVADAAQRDLLFRVLRYREIFPGRVGRKFYCCPRCTAKLHECVSSRVFRYIDNAKWKTAIEQGR